MLFVKVLEHIKKYSRCSNEDKMILLMDNHESNCSFEAVKYAKGNLLHFRHIALIACSHLMLVYLAHLNKK